MTIFTHKTLTFVGLLLLGSFTLCTPGVTFAASNSTSSTTTTGTAAKTSTTGTTKSYIQSAQKYTNEASGIFGSTTQATNAVNELSKSAGTGDLLGKNANILNDTNSYLTQGQSALKTADFLSDIDYKSVANGLKDSGDVDWKTLGSSLSTSASNIYNKVAENVGKYWDKLKGINMDSIWGKITNFQKDISAKIKQLVAGDLSEFDLESLSKALTSAGIPVEYVDLTPVGVATVVYEGQIPIAMDSQYAANVDYSAALGPIGNMDFRNGMCVSKKTNYDYTGMIRDYINGGAVTNEGVVRHLHLDTLCWVTIGIGSVLKEKGSTLDKYKAYFNTMEYVDKSNNLVDQATKDADITKFFNMEKTCRLQCGCTGSSSASCKNIKNNKCINRTEGSYASETDGRHISDQAVGDAIFNELCGHVKQLEGWDGGYVKLNTQLQQVALDLRYQGYKPIKSFLGKLTSNNCSGAYNQFAASDLCTGYKSRCTWRLSMIKQGCNAGTFSSN